MKQIMKQERTNPLKNQLKESILIVDENQSYLENLIQMLSGRGYKVQIETNGNLAFNTVQLTPPNLILLDIMMPKIDGYQICSQLKASPRTKDIPIIFISTLNEVNYKVKAFEIGGVDYITKPFQEQEVLARIENQLRISRLTQQLTQKNIKLSQEIEQRRKAEAVLRQSEESYGAIVESQTEIIVRFMPDKTITFVNEAYCRYFGQSQLELIGKPYQPRIYPDDQEKVAQLFDSLNLKNPVATIESRVVAAGEVRWMQWINRAIFNESGCLIEFQLVGRDITDRKQLETALQESQRWLWAINEANPNILYVYDLIKQRTVYTNREIYTVLGYTPEEIQQMGRRALFLLMHPDDVATVRNNQKRLKRSTKAGQIIESEYRMRHKNGEWRWLFAREVVFTRCAEGKPKQILTAAIDISDRKQIEEALRRSETQLREAQAIAHIGSWDYDLLTQKTTWSEELFRIYGLDPFSFSISNDSDHYIHPEDRDEFLLLIEQAITQNAGFKDDIRIIRVDGEIRHIEVRGQPILNDQGQIVRLVGSCMDITELKNSETQLQAKACELEQTLAQLKRTQSHLIQSEKMSALGQMVAGVAHEINNPVSFIYCNITPANGYVKDLLNLVELYQRHYPEPVSEIAEQLESIDPGFIAEDFPKLLLSIKEGAERISQIVLSLKNFSRLDEAERKRVDIHQGIDNTLILKQHRLKQQSRRQQIKVVKQYDELPKVMCFPGLINQVFMNILSNAIDAIDEVGWSSCNEEPTIWIRTELIEDSRLKRDDTGTSTSRICIRIANNGSPINPDVLPKIFDPFFTTKPVGCGMGLGLSIGYQIVVEQHGGRLSCNVTAEQKIEFVIELPA